MIFEYFLGVPICALSGTPQTGPQDANEPVGPMTADLAGFSGVAALPATALDPPHNVASPAVPALDGSGSPIQQKRIDPLGA